MRIIGVFALHIKDVDGEVGVENLFLFPFAWEEKEGTFVFSEAVAAWE